MKSPDHFVEIILINLSADIIHTTCQTQYEIICKKQGNTIETEMLYLNLL